MSDVRKLIALFIAVMGLGVAAFGVVRGLSASGPAKGVRLIVQIAPPVDGDLAAIAERVVRGRLEEKDREARVVPAGDRLVAELAEDDPRIVGDLVQLIERTAKLELRIAGATVLDGSAIHHVEVVDHGVAIDTVGPVRVQAGAAIEVVLDGKVRFRGAPDRIAASSFHLPVPQVRDAAVLVDVLEAGAAHPMHVLTRESFTRATGFLPRAWLFFAVAGVLLVAAALVGRRRR